MSAVERAHPKRAAADRIPQSYVTYSIRMRTQCCGAVLGKADADAARTTGHTQATDSNATATVALRGTSQTGGRGPHLA
jgi:hypothetical protein